MHSTLVQTKNAHTTHNNILFTFPLELERKLQQNERRRLCGRFDSIRFMWQCIEEPDLKQQEKYTAIWRGGNALESRRWLRQVVPLHRHTPSIFICYIFYLYIVCNYVNWCSYWDGYSLTYYLHRSHNDRSLCCISYIYSFWCEWFIFYTWTNGNVPSGCVLCE